MDEPRQRCPRCGVSYPTDVLFCPKDGAPLGGRRSPGQDDPYVGLTIGDQFHIQDLIGLGAMGRVYRAHQRGIDRQVAIKILHRELVRNVAVSARFQREAKVASRLAHPNVVQVLMTGEVDQVSADVGGEAYLVMEYLDGISLLSALAAGGGALSLPRALHVILQVCDAVGEAHAQGIVHRDLKPENVMLVRRGDDRDFVKVLDFGVARIDWADNVATQAGAIFGTARYVSPEGARGETVTSTSDVYSIATMLYQCLCGQTPFDGDSSVAILIKHTTEVAADIREVPRGSYVPEALAKVLAQNLARNPELRCQDARELGRALLEAAKRSGVKADELVGRSTLLGRERGATLLTSMERTRALDLSPGLAEKLEGGPPEPEPEPPRDSCEPLRSTTVDEPASVVRSVATVVDEPAPTSLDVVPAALPTATGSTGGERSQESQDEVPAPVGVTPNVSFADDWAPPSQHPGATARRWGILVTCFALGVGLVLVVTMKLNLLGDAGGNVETFRKRARAAAASGAWDTPPGENVKDITDLAQRKWPDDPGILDVRRDAAIQLLALARQQQQDSPEEALRALQLARELDPANDTVSGLLARLNAPTQVLGELPPPPVEERRRPPSAAKHTPVRSTLPTTKQAGSAEAQGDAVPSPPPSASSPVGGRWL